MFFGDQDGNVFGYGHEVTQQKELAAQLMQAAKMEAVGQMAAGTAHNFNNLLTVIRGYSELALEDLALSPDLRGGLEEIRRATDSGADLVRRLMSFSRQERPGSDQRPIDLRTAVEDALALIQPLVGRKVELDARVTERELPCLVHANEILQVIMNLATNALDAMSGGGRLTVTLQPCGPAMAELAVGDTGHGIEPAIVDRIFEPFFTTKAETKGTGLGLSFVYATVTKLGGHVDVESWPGEGCTFRVYLPLAMGASENSVAQ